MKLYRKICKQCGAKFKTWDPRIEFCNLGCKEMSEGVTEHFDDEAVCPVCGTAFIKKTSAHICCSAKCQHRYHYLKKHPDAGSDRHCAICGAAFQPRNGTQKYCKDCKEKKRNAGKSNKTDQI